MKHPGQIHHACFSPGVLLKFIPFVMVNHPVFTYIQNLKNPQFRLREMGLSLDFF